MGVISSVVAGTIGTAALLGAGTGAAIVAATRKKPKVEKAKIPEAPTPETAEEKAREDVKRRRKIIARTGGKTILSSQFGGNIDSAGKMLLGE